jgi:cytoskeletal protein CcmA (bactofilin family)
MAYCLQKGGMMKKESKIDAVSTFLGHDATFDGVINFKGTVRLDGRVKGSVTSDEGTVIIGDKAMVEADIQVETVIIKGSVSGKIQARNRIEAHPPARIQGELQAPNISIHSGVVFNGSCSMDPQTKSSGKTS